MSVAAFTDADLSGGTAYQIGNAFAAQTISRILRTTTVNRLYRIAVLFGISLIQTLLNRIHAIIVSGSATGIGIAVAAAEKTD